LGKREPDKGSSMPPSGRTISNSLGESDAPYWNRFDDSVVNHVCEFISMAIM
jgi:hypothetical protein